MNPKPKTIDLTPEDEAKVERLKRSKEKTKVSPEELLVAEFGYYYGWQAMLDLLDNKVTLEDAMKLLEGGRKVWNSKMVDQAYAMYIASAAANSGKKSKQILQKGLNEFIKQSKADM